MRRLLERVAWRWRWRESLRLPTRGATPKLEPYGYRVPRDGVAPAAIAAIVVVAIAGGTWLGTKAGTGHAKPTADALLGAASPTATPAAFRTRLRGAVAALATARANGRLALSGAGAPAGQARAARALAAAYRSAARRLGPLQHGAPAAQGRVLEALQHGAKAYSMLALAVRAGDRAGYGRAAKAVAQAEAELEQLIGSPGSIA